METSYLRRPEAGAYLKEKYKFSGSRSLAVLASTGGGPKYRRRGRTVIYDVLDLDEWAKAQLSGPVSSTSEYEVRGGFPKGNKMGPRAKTVAK